MAKSLLSSLGLWLQYVALAVWIGASGLIWWFCCRLKRVWLDGGRTTR